MKTSLPAIFLCALVLATGSGRLAGQGLALQARRLVPREGDTNCWTITVQNVQWDPKRTAAIVCDMWDRHWCRGATARVAEMAPRMNKVLEHLRAKGVLIIHAPSDTLPFYERTPGRELAKGAPVATANPPLKNWCGLDPAREGALPIDDSDGGCDDVPPCPQGNPWRRQIETITIKPGDAITDNAEAFNLMSQRGITNVLVMGVHQNMCVLGRPFSIRQMVYQGQNVLLVRDLTDCMYNSRQPPHVSHFIGNDLVTWHIEKHWCPTISSEQILGGDPFCFSADNGLPRKYNGSGIGYAPALR